MRTLLFTLLFGAISTVLSIPVKPAITNTSALPVHFGIVVLPGFQALDAFGPLDVFNSLALLFNLTMDISVIAKTLEPVSTALGKTERMNMTHSPFGEKIVTTATFNEVLQNETLSNIDVLLVPGGAGTREPLLEEIDFVRAMYPKVKYIMSVCTGATILARAGILDGHKATTNKRAWAWATSTGPKADWVHTARWVEDGNIWTSSGVAAGIDMTYAWVGHVYGEAVADYMGMSAEYPRWLNSTYDPFAAIWS